MWPGRVVPVALVAAALGAGAACRNARALRQPLVPDQAAAVNESMRDRTVRISLADGSSTRRAKVELRIDGASWSEPGGPRSVPLAALSSLRVTTAEDQWRGAKHGALLGGLAGALVGAVALRLDDDNFFTPGQRTQMGAMLGGLAGAVSGLVLGSLVAYRTVYWFE